MQIMKAYIGGLQLASNPGIADPAILETIACREALTRAEDLSIQKVCISSDCQVALGDTRKSGTAVRRALSFWHMLLLVLVISCFLSLLQR
jgi:hypothetical protein